MIEIIEKLSHGKCIGKCECGIVKEFYTSNITTGKSKSCGCLQKKENIPNSVKRTFNLMRYRCNTKTSPDYYKYGGRGIKVLYKTVDDFYEDVGAKPTKEHTIDRIDTFGNYEKGNCRWATRKEQSNNISSNVRISYNGENKTIGELAECFGLKYTTLKERLKRGWDIETALIKEVDVKCWSKKQKKEYNEI